MEEKIEKAIPDNHKSGFVNIIGKPNAGKSSIMNLLVAEELSVINQKAQTTRDRILGMVNTDDYQIVYSDTPGIVSTAKSDLHRRMNSYVKNALEDADVLLYVIDYEDPQEDIQLINAVQNGNCPCMVMLNKIDLAKSQEDVEARLSSIQDQYPNALVVALSALRKFNYQGVLPFVLEHLPVSPPFFDKDRLTDKSQRFFASEIIRGKLLRYYSQEIPYSCAVVIDRFQEGEELYKIEGQLYVERDSQKGIILGKGGLALKRTSTAARKDMEEFFQKRVFLRLQVKVLKNWRNDTKMLERLGYHPE